MRADLDAYHDYRTPLIYSSRDSAAYAAHRTMPLFSKLRGKSAQNVKAKQQPDPANSVVAAPPKPRYVSTWTSSEIVPGEVEELVEVCTAEMKLRGMFGRIIGHEDEADCIL